MTFKYEVMKTVEALAKGYEVSSSRQEDISRQVRADLINGMTHWITDSLSRRQDPYAVAAFPWCVARIPVEQEYTYVVKPSVEAKRAAEIYGWAVWFCIEEGEAKDVAAANGAATRDGLKFRDESRASWYAGAGAKNNLAWAVLKVPSECVARYVKYGINDSTDRVNYGKNDRQLEKVNKTEEETRRSRDLDLYTKAQHEDPWVWVEQSGASAARASRAWSEDVKAGLKRLEEQRKQEYAQRFPCQGTLPEDLE